MPRRRRCLLVHGSRLRLLGQKIEVEMKKEPYTLGKFGNLDNIRDRICEIRQHVSVFVNLALVFGNSNFETWFVVTQISKTLNSAPQLPNSVHLVTSRRVDAFGVCVPGLLMLLCL